MTSSPYKLIWIATLGKSLIVITVQLIGIMNLVLFEKIFFYFFC